MRGIAALSVLAFLPLGMSCRTVPCDEVAHDVIRGPVAPFVIEACLLPSECTEAMLLRTYCRETKAMDGKCAAQGECPLGSSSCRGAYESDVSDVVARNCTGLRETCPEGKVDCRCEFQILAGKKLECGCRCQSPETR